MTRHSCEFQTIRSEGGLLPPDLLRRVLDPKEKLPGTRPEDYELPQSERLNEVITQSWNRLRKHWAELHTAAANLPDGEPGTGLTNDKWNLPLLRELGFGLVPASAGPEVGGRTYAINRFFGPVPLHLIGCGLSLDRRAAGVRGAAAVNPHGLVQEFLNRSAGHLWAIVSNGLRLRVLRDNQALSRQSFLEFDLEGMFVGEVYSDFVLLWLMAHATRFVPRETDRPETCWLEQWTKVANAQGTRVLGDLRGGVETALQILGEGFTSHPKNIALRDALRTGQVPLADFHGQLLRVVYRLIFLFVAEDRTIDGQSLLHLRDDSDAARTARERFADHYSTARLRELASKIKGSRHGDLWRQLQLLVGALSGDAAFAAAREHLALPVLGSFLWSLASTAILNEAELTNYDCLEALRDLAFTRQGKVLRPVDYRNLGAEELGGVYESLLALTPQISADGARFTFAEFAGNERKTSGSYYTPDALVQCLLDSALDPVVEEAIKGKTGTAAEQAILALKVCDPAVGSGHFLVGAAHRLARHLARVRALAQGESEPSPLLYQHALRDVIGRCLYGVDTNPMAAELCRVSLWLEALEPGKPLSFLDHHIRVGNSLLGATPALIAAGLPDDAFTAIEGDDKQACAVLKKRNKAERQGQGPLFAEQDAEIQTRLQQAAAALEELPDDRPEDIRAKKLAFRRHEQTEDYRHKKQLANAWCAAFVIRKHFREPGREASASGITQGHLNDLASGGPLPSELAAEAERLARQYQFFHWHLAFPEVFAKGGFDCVLGNPPWERVKLQDKEWFAERSPAIANAPNAVARKRLIDALKAGDPTLYQQFLDDSRKAEGESHLMRDSGRYPLCGRGDINVYTVFAEGMRTLLNDRGHVGCVLPTGIATDDTTKFFFQDVIEKKSLASLYSFENEEFIFPTVHHATKFCLFTAGSGQRPTALAAQFVFFARQVEHLRDAERHFTLTAEDIALLNPNTRTCPIFRSRHDAELTKAIYRRVPVLIREARDGRPEENPWGIKFSRMFDMSNDSNLFRTREQLEADGWQLEGNIFRKDGAEYLPLYEAKMIHHFDHRWATYNGLDTRDLTLAEKQNPARVVHGRYWVPHDEVLLAMANVPKGLVEAYRAQNTQILAQMVMLWLAGYHLNRGNEKMGNAILLRHGSGVSDTMTHALGQWIGVRAMEQAFPLTADDLAFIQSQPLEETSFLRVALHLLETRTPRWFLGWRDITTTTNERTVVGGVFPLAAVGNNLPVWTTSCGPADSLASLLSSLACDFAARFKVGGTHLNFFIAEQIPVLPPAMLAQKCSWSGDSAAVRDWLLPRVLELTYTAWDLEPFARDCGWSGPPFHWDEERRFLLRCQLDAAFFHLYLPAEESGDWRPTDGETAADLARLKASFPTPRDAVAHIMDTFPIVRRRDEEKYNGDYRTKRVILEIYDAMQESIRSGQPYQTHLDPPPADPRCCHPAREESQGGPARPL